MSPMPIARFRRLDDAQVSGRSGHVSRSLGRGPWSRVRYAAHRANVPTGVHILRDTFQDANLAYRNEPLDDAARAACIGEYGFGTGAPQRLTVAATPRGSWQIRRQGVSTGL